MNRLLSFLSILLIVVGCQNNDVEPKEIILDLPEVPLDYISDDNMATLGRVLFYDPQLSTNNSISCASCHKQAIAFSDNRQFSRGFENLSTVRNSMPIQNLGVGNFFFGADSLGTIGNNFIDIGFFPSAGLFWDGRGVNHSTAMLLPIINHVEMGIRDLDYLTGKLAGISYYDELFLNAFGDTEITPERIGDALNSFLININSVNTKLDRVLRGEDDFTAKELIGAQLFINTYECNSCHQIESPSGYVFAGTFANIGLDDVYDDPGLEKTSNFSFDNGKFKIPSLRNVVLTGPYMHDGRFESLEDVIMHYSDGVEDHPNLDPRLRNDDGTPIKFTITDSEVSAIIAFLGTLTDHSMLTDEKLSNPFRTN